MDEYNSGLARQKQAEYCKENKAPHFAPERGTCWSCHRNIYEPVCWKDIKNNAGWSIRRVEVPASSPDVDYRTGVTVEQAGAQLITGCPHCNRSYCD